MYRGLNLFFENVLWCRFSFSGIWLVYEVPTIVDKIIYLIKEISLPDSPFYLSYRHVQVYYHQNPSKNRMKETILFNKCGDNKGPRVRNLEIKAKIVNTVP